MCLVWKPEMGDGCYCKACLDDKLSSLYKDIKSDYPELEDPEAALQELYRYMIHTGNCFSADGEKMGKYDFLKQTGMDYLF